MTPDHPDTEQAPVSQPDADPCGAEHSGRRPMLSGALRGRLGAVTAWGSGLLGLASLSLLSNGGQIGPCPCCGGLACPNAAAAQGLLGGGTALAIQFWSRLWGRKKE